MKKKAINESSITNFINKFLDNIQKGTQDRFIQKAKEKGVPEEIINKMGKFSKTKLELEREFVKLMK